MIDYKALYYGLFNGITDVAKDIEAIALSTRDEQFRSQLEHYIIALRQLQIDAENSIISEE